MIVIEIIFLTSAILALLIGLVAQVRAWRRPPYLTADFIEASVRIWAGLARLVWRMEQEDVIPAGLAEREEGAARKIRRREYRLLQRDMLAATSYILERADEVLSWYGENPPVEPDVLESLRDTIESGVSLGLRLGWLGLRLAFPEPRGLSTRSILEAGRRFVLLCLDFLAVLQHHGPETPETRRSGGPPQSSGLAPLRIPVPARSSQSVDTHAMRMNQEPVAPLSMRENCLRKRGGAGLQACGKQI